MRVGLNAYFVHHRHTGSASYLRHLVRALREVVPDLELKLYVPVGSGAPPDPGAWLEMAPGCSLAFISVPGWARGQWPKLLFEQVLFPRAALADGCQVLHVPYFAPPLVGAGQTVATVHDVIPLLLPQYHRRLLPRAYNWLISAAARRARLLIADSCWTLRDAVQLLPVPARRVRVVHLAVSDAYRPVSDPGGMNAVRARYHLPMSYLLYLGGFDRRKGVDALLRAYARLRNRVAEAPALVLAGRLPEAESEALLDPRPVIGKLGLAEHVRLVGDPAEEDKPALYSGCLAFVFPSVYEGFGLPPLEAMACGAPVIACRAASMPEVCGEAALLVAPGDERELARAMEQASSDSRLREELSERGLCRASQFSWQETARKTAAVYREVTEH